MHPRNKMRLLAGLTIDHSLEVTPPKQRVTEAREVPNRKAVQSTPANLKKKQESINKACQHVRNAVKALEAAPATDTSAEIPQMIGELEEMCSDLEGMSSSIVIKEGSAMPGCENEESSSKPYAKDANGKIAKKKYPGEENCSGNKKNKECSDVMENEMPGERPTTSQQFKDGDVVLNDNGIYIVVLSDSQADMVGIIPAGLANASADEKNRAVEMVKPDKLRKPTEEEMNVMSQSPEQRASIDDDMAAQFSMESWRPGRRKTDDEGDWEHEVRRDKHLDDLVDQEDREKRARTGTMLPEVKRAMMEVGVDPANAKLIAANEYEFNQIYNAPDYPHPPHKLIRNIYRLGDTNTFIARVGGRVNESTLNYRGNQVSHEDTESDPINVVGQGEKQWANSLDPKTVKSEIPTQLDQRGDASMDDYETKIKVPAKIKSDLRSAIQTFRSDAEKMTGRNQNETEQLYMDTADAFEKLLQCLEKGTLEELKKAQIFATSLMGPMLHKLPDGVWDFIVNGGQKKSLKDYMIKIGK